ncbi:hypothetical protein FHR24_001052 [Wenyingzhuangia heitensis]|uniref:Uncharacterized protein n=1 Tax=Wenyingzhuangia heitensis TaxID=1487859 RepID=A0ABX0U8T4_9FLAO|nr:hypothetical protein [Wenyingzhuangia heitensis]NIJ44613.1 hypothetical protein [Wenyingzhuangia heitensis]
MKKRICPCCNSTLRSKKRKKKFLKLLFFVELLNCARCSTFYAYLKGLDKTVCITPGVSEENTTESVA